MSIILDGVKMHNVPFADVSPQPLMTVLTPTTSRDGLVGKQIGRILLFHAPNPGAASLIKAMSL